MKLNISISDLANITTIVSIPLTILTWLFTRERFAKFWKKWFKWILTIVVVIGIVGLWRIGWLNWLQYRFACPVWALILLSVAGLAIASCIIVAIAFLNRTPDYLLYVSDRIFGVDWHWQYERGKLREHNLMPYCPKPGCSCLLEPQEISGYRVIDDILLICDHCGFRKDFDCNLDELRWKVAKEIERYIRTEEFRERLKKNRLT